MRWQGEVLSHLAMIVNVVLATTILSIACSTATSASVLAFAPNVIPMPAANTVLNPPPGDNPSTSPDDTDDQPQAPTSNPGSISGPANSSPTQQQQPQTQPKTPAPAPGLISAKAMGMAVTALRAEARAFEQTHLLKRQEPNFADSFQYHVDPFDVLDAIMVVQDSNDPIADGYIRWQLLSFHPPIDQLTNDQIQQLGARLPRLRESIADNAQLQRQFNSLASAAEKDQASKQALSQAWDKLQRQELEDELMNLPSMKFRQFILANLAPSAAKGQIYFLLANVADEIEAGIDTRSIKMKVTKTLKARMNDPALTEDDRWMFIKLITKMSETENLIIRKVEMEPGKPVKVSMSTLAVRSTDVDHWSAYLNHHEP